MSTTEPSRRRVRRGHAEWQRLIEAQRTSGLGQQAFCDQRELSLSTFQNWKRRLSIAPTLPELPAAWVELPARLDVPGGWQIELDLGGGVTLRLRPA